MKLSDLMKLPNWAGHIYVNGNHTQFKIAENDRLMFTHMGSTFYVADQDVRMNADGGIFIYVKARNRMNRALPSGIRIYLLNKDGKLIKHADLDRYLPCVPMQGYYGTAHRSVMAY